MCYNINIFIMELKRAEFIVTGIVQGVGYRYFVYRNAGPLGLKGFARNLPDGTVHVVVEGKETAVNELHKVLKKGPAFSRVDKVSVAFREPKHEFSDFDTY
jgi:acylphosphatase